MRPDPEIFPAAPRVWAIVPCAGSGSRAATALPKQYHMLRAMPVVARTLAAFEALPGIDATVVALAPTDTLYGTMGLPSTARVRPVNCGGATRAQTVANALAWLKSEGGREDDWVLVHDAARCLVTPQHIETLMTACAAHPVGGLLAQPLADTLKQGSADAAAVALATVPRHDKWLAQTPQMFRLGTLERALRQAGPDVTDEASAIEALGLQPLLVQAAGANFKLTYPDDFALAEAVLAQREADKRKGPNMALRIGQGWDVHALVAGRPLVLGGVHIEHASGLLGHSDADVLTHAIIDALLGAAGLGDIGRHFPDTDERYRGANSLDLLRHTAALLRAAGLCVVNVDSTVVAQAPRLAPHIAAMRQQLSSALGLSTQQVNVKAKTAEHLGPVGEGRAMEAQAIAMLEAADG